MALDTSKPLMDIVGNYEITEKIAEGGMGTVYKARHRETGEVVALKLVPPNMATNSVFIKRFEQEFRAASMLDHPNIIRALDFGYHGEQPYLVMEYVDGESLGQKIERDGKIAEADAIRIIAQVAQALYRAHKQGLIHRDVKPDNVMVTHDGQVKLADLGLVKEVEAELNLTRTGRGLGTPHFMPPEQFRNAKNADVRCDIYAMGATLYMMVTGELPFRSNGPLDAWMKKVHNELVPPKKLVPTLSDRTEEAILKAMNSDPNKRPATCREFVEELTGHTSRRQQAVAEGEGQPPADIWYLVYKDEEGLTHTVKGTTDKIRQSLNEGRLGDASNVRACRTKTGEFLLLGQIPEFQDLVTRPATGLPKPLSGPSIAHAHGIYETVATPKAVVTPRHELTPRLETPVPAPLPQPVPVAQAAPVEPPHIPVHDSPTVTNAERMNMIGAILIVIIMILLVVWYALSGN